MNIPHPYADQHGIRIYHRGDSWVVTGKTYGYREQLKAIGCHWNPSKKEWYINPQAPDDIRDVFMCGAWMMIAVEVAAHCHEPQQEMYANHREVECGYMRLGCGMCDRYAICGDDVKILRIIDAQAAQIADVSLPTEAAR